MTILTDEEASKKIKKLINEIRYYDYMYYIKYESVISDVDYDLLKNQLEVLENTYPHLIEKDSPTYTVGFQQNFIFNKEYHEIPMLSLRNTYILDEAIEFINKENLWPVILEAKIDGISLSLIYMDGYLHKAILRGNGEAGENVLDHIIYTSIPIKIPFNEKVEIRGELYINKENFIKINNDKVKNHEAPFQNSRNGCGGIIRNKKRSYEEFLDFIPYFFKYNNEDYFSHQNELLEKLQEIGFSKQIYYLCANEEDLQKNITNFYHLPFANDGVVIKTNDLSLMKNLGTTDHHPKGSIAYKFTNNHKESIIHNILWQVSRNGRVIPVGEINPIELDNAIIKKITLHNKKYMEINNLYVGAHIMIERVGSTVPQIKKVLKGVSKEEVLNNKQEFIKKNFISNCPSCNSLLEEDDKSYMCVNKNCPHQINESIGYFFSEIGLKGVGTKTIHELIKFGKTPSDIINLIIKKTQLNLHGWEKFCFYGENIIKNINVGILLSSLGIENISKKSLEILCKHFNINKLEELRNFLEGDFKSLLENLLNEEKTQIKNIGKEKLKSFLDFLTNNKEEILKIISSIESLQ
jgi:DNA ligase (NAD+)